MHRLLVIGATGLAALALSSAAAAWSWPADGDVLRGFSLDGAYAAGQHRGIDVAGPDGAPVRAPASGIVTFAGTLPTYGRGVTILTSDGYSVTLVHLGSIGVSKGDAVAEGVAVGTMGSSGDPEHAVPSVHLGIRVAARSEGYVDPAGLLPPRSTAPPPAPAPPAPAAAPAPAPATVGTAGSAPPPSTPPAAPPTRAAAAAVTVPGPVATAGQPSAPSSSPAPSPTVVAPQADAALVVSPDGQGAPADRSGTASPEGLIVREGPVPAGRSGASTAVPGRRVGSGLELRSLPPERVRADARPARPSSVPAPSSESGRADRAGSEGVDDAALAVTASATGPTHPGRRGAGALSTAIERATAGPVARPGPKVASPLRAARPAASGPAPGARVSRVSVGTPSVALAEHGGGTSRLGPSTIVAAAGLAVLLGIAAARKAARRIAGDGAVLRRDLVAGSRTGVGSPKHDQLRP